MCPRSSDPFYIVTYYIKWVTISWTLAKRGGKFSDGWEKKEKENKIFGKQEVWEQNTNIYCIHLL